MMKKAMFTVGCVLSVLIGMVVWRIWQVLSDIQDEYIISAVAGCFVLLLIMGSVAIGAWIMRGVNNSAYASVLEMMGFVSQQGDATAKLITGMAAISRENNKHIQMLDRPTFDAQPQSTAMMSLPFRSNLGNDGFQIDGLDDFNQGDNDSDIVIR
jgi:hypothetical protein